ncbi:hypothetical protein [Flavobacterium crassostreae]|uniref:Uncharacterized protein n=1 Tax=Flavobacterium crassostreae TaxID=1763534 RepID=A0A1B9E7F4_9FLAO|nr:hypothetical protein [Flavobacterium crassostreae]OCB77880.1 hypothetical protein LPBF_02715 [Flavobacterium crassostreae]
MEKKNLNKKPNNEDFSKKCSEKENKSPSDTMPLEIEVDKDGQQTLVQRARNNQEIAAIVPEKKEKEADNENLNRGVTTEKEAMITVENKDLNSDITAKRYPNSHPDNHTDRGNMNRNEDK